MIKRPILTRPFALACCFVVGTMLGVSGCKSSSSAGAKVSATTSTQASTTTAAAPAASASVSSSAAASSAPAVVPAASSAAASSTTPAAAPAGGKLNGVPTSCPPAAEVMSNLHLTSLVVDGADPSICGYLFNGDQAAPYVLITFNALPPGLTPATLQSALTSGQTNVKAVPGLGDAAFSFDHSPGLGLIFLSGDTVCGIATEVPTTTHDEVALAKSILAG